jgi:hypothetical protein
MARGALPPKPGTLVLTPEQKRYRVERLRICIRRVEAFDPAETRFGAPEVLKLEMGIDKALSGAFGYGTPSYLRYNLAARLESDPLVLPPAIHDVVLDPVGEQESHDAQEAQEARRRLSDSKERSIALLRQAVAALEQEMTGSPMVVRAAQQSEATRASNDVSSIPSRADGMNFNTMWYRFKRWTRKGPHN